MTLSFLVDEHVPRVITSTLRSHGYAVVTAQERYGDNSDDEELLADCRRDGLILVTKDRDFTTLARERDHGGVILYTSKNPPAGSFVRAIERVERLVGGDELSGQVVWIEDWFDDA